VDRALLAWLSGRELDAVQLERVGATSALGEEIVVPALKSLAAAASVGAPIVVVFDQLENLIDRGADSSRLFAYAQLTTELVDTVHGMVLVQMALDTEWDRSIEPSFNLAQRSRLAMNRHLLGLPTPKEREELLRLWVERLPDKPQPFPWPFGERALRRLCDQAGTTPRMLLIALRQAVEGGGATSPAGDAEPASAADEVNRTQETLSETWNEYLADARQALDEASDQKRCVDPLRLTDGILAALRFLPGLKLLDVRASRAAQIRIARGSTEVHVALVHQPHHKSIGATLTKLTELARAHDVVAVRERGQDFPPTWKDTVARRATLLEQSRAQWFFLEREDAARLLALGELLKAARSRDIADHLGRALEEEEVSRWVTTALDVPSWTLSRMLRGEKPTEEVETPVAPAPAALTASGFVLPVLKRLRLLSIDRLVREVVRVDPSATRASIMSELDALTQRVRWVGRSIVYLQEES
jgi:hypothetical protein